MNDPKMLFDPAVGFYCSYCDYYFESKLERAVPTVSHPRWVCVHHKVVYGGEQVGPLNCPFEGKTFEIDVMKVLPEAREVVSKHE